MKLRLSRSAEEDLVEGYHFYEQQTPGVGAYLLDSLFADIGSLALYAGAHSRSFGFYRALSKRFPFAIYYDLETDEIRVYGVLDCRRKPSWIRKRLKGN